MSQPWAGKGWGAVSTPRIGQEVIVDFLEGDPDQPIITGRVYNAESQPPFGFPAGAVLSGIKSNTHKGGGYNELSMDDTAGKEKITIHGQYDMNTTVEHDQTNTVGVDQDEQGAVRTRRRMSEPSERSASDRRQGHHRREPRNLHRRQAHGVSRWQREGERQRQPRGIGDRQGRRDHRRCEFPPGRRHPHRNDNRSSHRDESDG